MKKIWIVSTNGVYDGDNEVVELFAYRNEQAAIKKLNELIDADRKENEDWYYNAENDENPTFIIDRSSMSFSIYEDYNYLLNHYDIAITEVELN